jgi:uncharacterized protein with HEPN domain
MKRDDLVRIRHIIDAAEAAIRFVSSRKREDLDADEMLRFALLQAVQIVGEAASKLSADARQELADVPWPRITGMRNRLVHAYMHVNEDILWTTAVDHLPGLVLRLRKIPGVTRRGEDSR